MCLHESDLTGPYDQAAHPVLSHMPAQLQGSTTSAVDASKSLLQGAVINQLLSNYMQLCGMPQVRHLASC